MEKAQNNDNLIKDLLNKAQEMMLQIEQISRMSNYPDFDANKAEMDLVELDKKRCLLLQEAVEKDSVEAMFLLAECYRHGWGVDKNLKEALKLYEKASYNKFGNAKITLALLYSFSWTKDLGFPVSFSKSFELLNEAINLGKYEAVYWENSLQQFIKSCGNEQTAEEEIMINSQRQ